MIGGLPSLGSSTSTTAVKLDSATTDSSVWSGSVEVFQAASTFIGAKPGWVFNLGVHGVGYYQDIRDAEIESDLYKDSTESVARLATLKLAWRGRFDRLPQVLARTPCLWNAAFEDGTNLLHLACYKDDMTFLNLAITEGNLDVDVLGRHGRTPLMWAAGFGHISAMRFLLNSRADPRRRDETGSTALLIAARNVQHTAVLFMLAQSSDDRDSVLADSDLNGCTAIHWAALRGDLEGLKLLSRFRADLQQVDGLQNTVLHYAVQADKTPEGALHSGKDLLVWLLQQGVDPAKENTQGKTCMDVAKDSENPAVLAFLEQALKAFTEGRSKLKQTKKDDYTPLDLEKGSREVNDDVVFKEWGVYLPLVVWICSVSFTVLEYILEVRQLAWESLWLRWGALAFECCVLVSVVLFYYIARGDPGKVPLKEYGSGSETFLRALRSGQEIPAKRLCTTTWVLKDLRTKYCKQTGACVQEFDHFCDFTVCAIGKGNHRPFIILLIIEAAAQCWYLFLCAMIVWQTRGMPATVWDSPTWAWNNAWQYPLMVIGVGIHCASLPFVGYLLASQAYMIVNNATMNELENFTRYDHLWVDNNVPKLSRIFDKGDPIRNVLDFWWYRARSEVGPNCRAQIRELAASLRDAGAK